MAVPAPASVVNTTTNPPLSPAESTAVRILATAMTGFAAYGFATGASSTVSYLLSVIAVGLVIRHFRREPLPGPLATGLAVAATTHLAGGLVRVGNDVLYNASTGPYIASLHTHVLQYDHFAHTFAVFVGTLTLWTLLAAALERHEPTQPDRSVPARGPRHRRCERNHRVPRDHRARRCRSRRLHQHRLGPRSNLVGASAAAFLIGRGHDRESTRSFALSS